MARQPRLLTRCPDPVAGGLVGPSPVKSTNALLESSFNSSRKPFSETRAERDMPFLLFMYILIGLLLLRVAFFPPLAHSSATGALQT